MAANYCPYAAPTVVVRVLQHYRGHQLPDELTRERLASEPGMSMDMASRVLRALEFLGLTAGYGQPTTDFIKLRSAPSNEDYKKELTRVLKRAYAHIFMRTDVAQASLSQIIEQFQPYDPASQHRRMATLFCGLCQEAGIPLQQQLRFPFLANDHKRANPARKRDAVVRRISAAPALADDRIWDLIRNLPAPDDVFEVTRRGAWLKAIDGMFGLVYKEK